MTHDMHSCARVSQCNREPDLWKKIHQNRSSIKINSSNVPVMAKPDYLLYSLVHGSVSSWFRLKWMCDIWLISNNGRDYDSPSLQVTTKTLGIERISMQGLLLSHHLFGMPVSIEVKDYSCKDPRVDALVHYCQFSLLGNEPGEIEESGIFTKLTNTLNHTFNYKKHPSCVNY